MVRALVSLNGVTKPIRHKVNVMDNLLRWRDEYHVLPLVLIASIVVLLAIVAAAL